MQLFQKSLKIQRAWRFGLYVACINLSFVLTFKNAFSGYAIYTSMHLRKLYN